MKSRSRDGLAAKGQRAYWGENAGTREHGRGWEGVKEKQMEIQMGIQMGFQKESRRGPKGVERGPCIRQLRAAIKT